MDILNYDVIIVGSGVAGLTLALELNETYRVLVVTKKKLMDSNSALAQGGICVKRDENDSYDFIRDTLRAGHYENDKMAVKIMVEESNLAIKTLEDYGVVFDKEENRYSYTREGGHGKNRILHVEDRTGFAIMEALVNCVRKKQNIDIYEDTKMIDLLVDKEKVCHGVVIKREDEFLKVIGKKVVLATGGLGGLYKNSTNYRHIKGDSIALAIKYGVELRDISYIQIHPTSLYEEKDDRRFLISESVRGEGAVLLNHKGKRFIDELKPRDIVSEAIFNEMKKDKSSYELLDISKVKVDFTKRFPGIYKYLKDNGVFLDMGLIPIVPSQHYTMGGIKVDYYLRTSMKNLFAAGEAASTGVHGKNRLASNSLLEAVVYSKRSAGFINEELKLENLFNINTKNLMDINKEIKVDIDSSMEYINKLASKVILEEIKVNEKSKTK